MLPRIRVLLAAGVLLLLALLGLAGPAEPDLLAVQGESIVAHLLDDAFAGLEAGREAPPVAVPVRFEGPPPSVGPVQGKLRKALEAGYERRWGGRDDGAAWLRPVEGGERPLVLRLAHEPGSGRLALTAEDRREAGALPAVTVEAAVAGWTSLFPPFLVLLLAVLTLRTIPSLFCGVLLGALMHAGPLGGLPYFVDAWLVTGVFRETFQLHVLGFVVLLSVAVALMTRSGGIEGMVELVAGLARSARSSQLTAWLMGLLVFFDDYANSIVVGSTMRPLTDRLRVSREKLAYIVDSTAAPIAGLVPLSTWVATEISYFQPQLEGLRRPDGTLLDGQGFSVFLETMPLRFYCLLTIIMVAMTILARREFGPMLTAERRARRDGRPLAEDARPMVGAAGEMASPAPGVRPRASYGLVPILLLVGVTIGLIVQSGLASLGAGGDGYWNGPWAELGGFRRLVEIVGAADSAWAIFCGSAAAALGAALLPLLGRALRPGDVVVTGLKGTRMLGFAVAILVLAWCIGFACDDLGSRYWLSALALQARDLYWLLPSILFLVACLAAFATGSSWTTMAILLPNVVLMANELGAGTDIGSYGLVVLSIGAVMEGAIFGDHCSPISDTTLLSSVATGSDHLHHVRTQAPYALLVMATALVLGYLPVAGLGLSPWIALVLGAVAILVFLRVIGRDPEAPPEGSAAP
ncbi:MAG: Na+/H+ antiporter NhaC family protein [Planctomycetota bacterium]